MGKCSVALRYAQISRRRARPLSLGRVAVRMARGDASARPDAAPSLSSRRSDKGMPMRTRSLHSVSLTLALGCAALGVIQVAADEAMVPEVRPGILAGYLSAAAIPDSVALLPPPRAEGSAALALDREI